MGAEAIGRCPNCGKEVPDETADTCYQDGGCTPTDSSFFGGDWPYGYTQCVTYCEATSRSGWRQEAYGSRSDWAICECGYEWRPKVKLLGRGSYKGKIEAWVKTLQESPQTDPDRRCAKCGSNAVQRVLQHSRAATNEKCDCRAREWVDRHLVLSPWWRFWTWRTIVGGRYVEFDTPSPHCGKCAGSGKWERPAIPEGIICRCPCGHQWAEKILQLAGTKGD